MPTCFSSTTSAANCLAAAASPIACPPYLMTKVEPAWARMKGRASARVSAFCRYWLRVSSSMAGVLCGLAESGELCSAWPALPQAEWLDRVAAVGDQLGAGDV